MFLTSDRQQRVIQDQFRFRRGLSVLVPDGRIGWRWLVCGVFHT